MNLHTLTFLPDHITVQAESGTTVLQAQIAAGLHPDAPCGGKGTCGKCKVIIDGKHYDAVSQYGDFITKGTKIKVTKYEATQVYVKVEN